MPGQEYFCFELSLALVSSKWQIDRKINLPLFIALLLKDHSLELNMIRNECIIMKGGRLRQHSCRTFVTGIILLFHSYGAHLIINYILQRYNSYGVYISYILYKNSDTDNLGNKLPTKVFLCIGRCILENGKLSAT